MCSEVNSLRGSGEEGRSSRHWLAAIQLERQCLDIYMESERCCVLVSPPG
jgi:hypothetical protein